jgi:hypothetical protein
MNQNLTSNDVITQLYRQRDQRIELEIFPNATQASSVIDLGLNGCGKFQELGQEKARAVVAWTAQNGYP